LKETSRGLVRPFPSSYATAYQRKGVVIDPSLALEQHRAYVRALENAGIAVDHLDADEAFYDCVFVEDTAIVWQSAVLITSMANPDRQGEQAAVRQYFAATHDLIEMPADARLDGGDVMHTDDVTYAGLSSRTNAAGVDALSTFLARAGRPVVAMQVSNALHLKTAATYLGNGTVVAAPGCVALDLFKHLRLIHTAPNESGAANCLRIGGSLVIPAGYPATERALKAFASEHQLRTEVLNISEFEKGGGSLSCLSLLWRHA
jgi:dimethylargininase